jgi:hypothetical protein
METLRPKISPSWCLSGLRSGGENSKSLPKSPPPSEYDGISSQPIRRLNVSSFSSGARDTSMKVVSGAFRWARCVSWSTNIEQPSQPSSWFAPNMK